MLNTSETVKLLQSSFSGNNTNEFGTTRTLKKSSIFRMLQSASIQLPLVFYSWYYSCDRYGLISERIALLGIFVVVMISGSIIYATAENKEINQIVKYNNQVCVQFLFCNFKD